MKRYKKVLLFAGLTMITLGAILFASLNAFAAGTLPIINNLHVIGRAAVGQTLTIAYDYYDAEGDAEGATTFKWNRVVINPTGQDTYTTISGATAKSYTLTAADAGCTLRVEVTPKDTGGNTGYSQSFDLGPIAVETPIASPSPLPVSISAPTAIGVRVIGNGADIGSTLTGVYNFAAPNGDAEVNSVYQWYRADAYNGAYTPISGATGVTYTIKANDKGKFIKFAVTPKTSSQTGGEVKSDNFAEVGNIAFYRPVVFSPSNGFNYRNAIFNIFDGNYGTCAYLYANQPTGAFVIDLKAHTQFNKVKLTTVGNPTGPYIIKCSDDGVNFTAGESVTPVNQIATLNSVNAGRYIRVEVGGVYSNSLFITDFAAYSSDTTAPVITLNGNIPANLLVGDTFTYPTYTAIDDFDGDITSKVIVSGTVDTNTVGTYTVTYTATDKAGNTATKSFTVNIVGGIQSAGDLAFGKTADASNGINASSAFDGNDNTYWDAQADTGWLQVDLGQAQYIDQVIIKELNSCITGYKIQVSNDLLAWQDIYTGTTIGASVSDSFDVVNARYVRLNILSSNTDMELGIRTFEVYISENSKVNVAVKLISLGVPDANAVTDDLPLPYNGAFGSIISWQSDNTNVVANDGTIHRAAVDTVVNLTATITLPNGTSARKVYTVKVLKAEPKRPGGGSGSGGGGRVYLTVSPIPTPTPTPATPPTLDNSQSSPKASYTDIDNAAWAKTYIEALSAKGVISGRGNGTFDPNGNITREEFVKLIVEAFGLKVDNAEVNFSDVPKGEWFYKYVAAASKNGIVKGVDAESFGVGRQISRQDMAVMAYRAAKAAGVVIKGGSLSQVFADEDSIADYAKESVHAMQSANIINGLPEGLFAPSAYATRAQAAKIIYLLYSSK